MNDSYDNHSGDAEDAFEIGIRIDSVTDEEPDEPDTTGGKNDSSDACGETGSAPVSEMLSNLDAIDRKLERLSVDFESKLKYDEHKNRIIDDLHRELQAHRDGVIKKHLNSMISDIIKIIDDIRKYKRHWESQAPSEETAANLLDFMDQIASDLEDLFSWQGVVAFTCDQNTFDSTRQRILKKVDTDDPEKNKQVAQSLRPGYEWDGKIIRPEMVSVYVYNEATPTKDQTD